eukprot:TRINITY_DN2786_c2_g4_i1.p1 TRINITY_DN2786_c2_g4~~TRINITY_DN2786_c2_g4_i1.p1  ORF type:complete len:429 (+),score=91.81 TRINITY_DN2786_c2_g4_i1:121-1407(+)
MDDNIEESFGNYNEEEEEENFFLENSFIEKEALTENLINHETDFKNNIYQQPQKVEEEEEEEDDEVEFFSEDNFTKKEAIGENLINNKIHSKNNHQQSSEMIQIVDEEDEIENLEFVTKFDKEKIEEALLSITKENKEERDFFMKEYYNNCCNSKNIEQSFIVSLYPLIGILFFFKHFKDSMKILAVPLILTLIAVIIISFLVGLILAYPLYYIIHKTTYHDHNLAKYYTGYTIFIIVQIVQLIVTSIAKDYSRREMYNYVFKTKEQTINSLHDMDNKKRFKILFFQIVTLVFLYLITSPLSLIPFGGIIIYTLCNATVTGWGNHIMYLLHVGIPVKQQFKWVLKHFGSYSLFGVVAVLLGFVPILSIFFGFTTCIGSALWAVELEDKNTFLLLYSKKKSDGFHSESDLLLSKLDKLSDDEEDHLILI